MSTEEEDVELVLEVVIVNSPIGYVAEAGGRLEGEDRHGVACILRRLADEIEAGQTAAMHTAN